MDIAIRVWERYRLANRVAERVRQGGSIGDPKHLLGEFQKFLRVYESREGQVERWLHLNKDVQSAQILGHTDKAWSLREQMDHEWAPRGAHMDISVFLRVHGFPAFQETARVLCLAILQQYALPDRIRKSIEVASKFWVKNPRMNPSGRTTEDSTEKRMLLYLDHLKDFRKHEKLFELAIQEGKSHGEGDLVTNLRAGSFLLVNAGGFDSETMESKIPLVEEVEQRMRRIGLGVVCYGSILISNRLSGGAVTAFYHPASDEFFVRADAKVSSEADYSICHELAHRYEHKFIPEKKSQIVKIYNTISIHSEVSVSYEDFPRNGEHVEYEGRSMVVTESDYRRRRVYIKDINDPKVGYTMPLQTYNRLKGLPEKIHPMDFVTSYAKRGGPSENFAEMVAFYAMGRLPEKQVELLLSVL